MFSLILLIIKLLLHLTGLVFWCLLCLLLMQVVLCKSWRCDLTKFFAVSRKRRLKIFKRNLKNDFYRSSLILFVISIIAGLKMVFDLYSNTFTDTGLIWLLFHPVLAFAIFQLYKSYGYRIELFLKFREFLNGEHE